MIDLLKTRFASTMPFNPLVRRTEVLINGNWRPVLGLRSVRRGEHFRTFDCLTTPFLGEAPFQEGVASEDGHAVISEDGLICGGLEFDHIERDE